MKKRFLRFSLAVGVAVITLAVVISFSGRVLARDANQKKQLTGIKLGAQLYDKWYKILDVEVEGNHPLYPADGKKSGGDTYRCKECHGWDYIGNEGRYKKGSHFTGIGGVYDSRGKSEDEIYKAITNKANGHDLQKLSDDPANVKALARFIREGLIDPNKVYKEDGSVKGDAAKGEPLYKSSCALCHGKDGDRIDFKKDKEGVQGVGWAANDNPQEILHKIRWGHPGSSMPSGIVDRGMSDADTVNVLKYSQTL